VLAALTVYADLLFDPGSDDRGNVRP